MSCCGTNPGFEELDEVSRLVSGKLAAFLKTLRDNGYAVGLAEGQDAAALMAEGYVKKPGLLRSFTHVMIRHGKSGPSASLCQWSGGKSQAYGPEAVAT